MAKYSFVVSSNTKYLDCLNVFLNSLESVGNKNDVHIVSWDLPKDYIDKLSALSYKTFIHEISKSPQMIALGEGDSLMRFRYELAAGLDYDSVCVVDADTLVCRDLTLWFEIAARADVIIGCGMEQKRWYGEPEEHHKVDGKHFIERTWDDKDLCCSPIFFNPKKFGDAFHFSWSIYANYPLEKRFKGPDMDAINMALIKYGYKGRVIALGEETWSGLHEVLLKPFSHISENHGQWWTINGEEIWVIHGQYLNKIWLGWQRDNQDLCIDRELDGSPRCKQVAKQSLEQIVELFKKMSTYKIKL